MKRLFDVVSSALGLVLLSPFLLVIAILVRLESPGPVIFRQTRVGRDNRPFTIYKFRSMRVGTPNLATDQLTEPYRYITRIGRIMRVTSLDELPQLWNIMIGDMSVVGPRPAIFSQELLVQMRTDRGVHRFRPGLTGWAQVNGRDDISDAEKVELDAHYCNNWSLALDMHILLRTVGVVSTAKGVRA
ncbi:MAG TPA: sugar transferase [Symbiobacteriaceae bacterium]|jgi:O-antigen biosynthesis protein WbqP|nr:sugar transferase [Symbiobacteriaceae bacterium]